MLNGWKSYAGCAMVILGSSLKVLGPAVYPGLDYETWGNWLITTGFGIYGTGLAHKVEKNTQAMLNS